MDWNNDEQENVRKGMTLSSKILLGIIACLIVIIILIVILLMNMKQTNNYSIYVDGKNNTTANMQSLLTSIDNKTYVNIEEFSKIVGYEYHKGEYKSTTTEEDKCYVQGLEETASFYLNDNKIYKLPVNKLEEQYEEYIVESTIKNINEKMYAPVDAISKAFNVVIDESNNYFKIYKLDYLVTLYDAKVIEWGYTSISNQTFENKKAILYGYLIVKKDGRTI